MFVHLGKLVGMRNEGEAREEVGSVSGEFLIAIRNYERRIEYLEAALEAIRVECKHTDRAPVVIAGSVDALARDALQHGDGRR